MRELPGHGMRGRVGGRDLVVGSLAWISSLGLSVPQDMESEAEALARAALSPVLVAVDGRVLGLAGLGDPLRPEAPGVVRALEDAGWKVRILSGDHPSVARVVGEALGLPPEAVQGGRSPEAKLAFVQERVTEARARGRLVMMVGDGINDAAALSAADIGVCVAGGSGASIQAADILLQRPGLFSLPLLEAASRRALRVVLRNLAFSLVYNVVTVSLALLGHVGPLLAAVLMPISSLTVIGSSVLARTFASPGTAGRARAPAALEPATSRPGAGPWK
jgi:Cu2+-exporting ATPase